MEDYERVFPRAGSHPFRIIAFDWDGTAVRDRKADARPVANTLKNLLDSQVFVVVITGTNFGNINRQFASLIEGPSKHNLFVCANRGSEVYGFDGSGRTVLIFRLEATPEEKSLLSQVAKAVKKDIEDQSNVKIDIVYNRLNRRKIDLIPEWKDPEKSQIGALMRATNKRLRDGGFKAGLKGAFELTQECSRRLGLKGARITSDVKHIEVGLTDKSDSIRWVINDLAKKRNIPFTDILVLGDEFGPVAGFEGSDYHMVTPKEHGMTYVSVGKEPHEVPEGVIKVGGGPPGFLRIMRDQVELRDKLSPTDDETFLLIETGYDPAREREIESLMTVGNGYMGTRGSLEEEPKSGSPATLVAGVYDKPSATAPEELVIFPDWLFTQIEVNGKKLQLTDGNMIEHRRILDMKKGVYRRIWRHRDDDGHITFISYLHFACLSRPHAMALRATVIPENYSGRIKLKTGLKCCRRNYAPRREPFFSCIKKKPDQSGEACLEKGKTNFTDIEMVESFRSTASDGFIKTSRRTRAQDHDLTDEWRWHSAAGQAMNISKFACIYTSRDGNALEGNCQLLVHELEETGVDGLLLEQADAWESRWRDSKVSLIGDPEGQKWINFAAYHLISAGNSRDDLASIGARALTGPVYKGHIFWEAEIFMLPFFIFTDPPAARAMLMYRYHALPAAREKAKEMGYKGALYAWESTISGREMTPSAAVNQQGEVIPILSGKLEQHISADVAYGVWSYWNATMDDGFLLSAGAEILVETARFWASRVERNGDTCYINGVEGPDEYHENVNNNIYTNMMASWNLRRAAEIIVYIRAFYPARFPALCSKIKLREGEMDHWHEVADSIFTDMARQDGIIEQFDGFFSLDDINVRDYEPRTAALDVILGRERTKTTRVVKQADAVLLLYLLENHFEPEVIRKNLLYYDRRTGHGSSLSPCIYGLVAARMGMMKMAVRYFEQAAQIDLSGPPAGSVGGIHTGAMGGLWQQLVMGFAGVRPGREGISMYPRMPSRWRRMEFSLKWRGCRLGLDIKKGKSIRLSLEGAGPVRAGIHGRAFQNLATGRTHISKWSDGAWQEFEEYE